MEILEIQFGEVTLLRPKSFPDERGYFMECFRMNTYQKLGFPPFVQDNLSQSKHGVLRGLHYQLSPAQGKLVSVIRGEIYDVAVDIRQGSPSFGEWVGYHLSEDNHRQLYIPEGFAHGFAVLSDTAHVLYKCTNYYEPTSDYGISAHDPDLNINWQLGQVLLSPKDQALPHLADIDKALLP